MVCFAFVSAPLPDAACHVYVLYTQGTSPDHAMNVLLRAPPRGGAQKRKAVEEGLEEGEGQEEDAMEGEETQQQQQQQPPKPKRPRGRPRKVVQEAAAADAAAGAGTHGMGNDVPGSSTGDVEMDREDAAALFMMSGPAAAAAAAAAAAVAAAVGPGATLLLG
jgi:hypothetical protein